MSEAAKQALKIRQLGPEEVERFGLTKRLLTIGREALLGADPAPTNPDDIKDMFNPYSKWRVEAARQRFRRAAERGRLAVAQVVGSEAKSLESQIVGYCFVENEASGNMLARATKWGAYLLRRIPIVGEHLPLPNKVYACVRQLAIDKSYRSRGDGLGMVAAALDGVQPWQIATAYAWGETPAAKGWLDGMAANPDIPVKHTGSRPNDQYFISGNAVDEHRYELGAVGDVIGIIKSQLPPTSIPA